MKNQRLKRQLKSITKAIARFIVLRPKASPSSPMLTANQRYSSKAGRYPYLPENEEARDWLEHIYSK